MAAETSGVVLESATKTFSRWGRSKKSRSEQAGSAGGAETTDAGARAPAYSHVQFTSPVLMHGQLCHATRFLPLSCAALPVLFRRRRRCGIRGNGGEGRAHGRDGQGRNCGSVRHSPRTRASERVKFASTSALRSHSGTACDANAHHAHHDEDWDRPTSRGHNYGLFKDGGWTSCPNGLERGAPNHTPGSSGQVE